MSECNSGANKKQKYARPDSSDFLIEGDQNVPDEKGEGSDWGYSIGQSKERRRK